MSITSRFLHAVRPVLAFAVVAGLFCSMNAVAAVPSGATTSLAALRTAYINAVDSKNAAALEALFDTTHMTPAVRDGFTKHISEEFGHKIASVVLNDPAPTLVSEYAKFGAHFPQPVIKTLKANFVAAPDQSDASEYYIGSSAGHYYFISLVRDDK